MKKVLKVSLLIITIVITFSYLVKNILNNYKNNIDFDYNMRDYDIAITRKDINCITKVFYLKKDKILVTSKSNEFGDDKEYFLIDTNNDINAMIKYVEKYGRKNNYSGLYIVTKYGEKRSIPINDNIIYRKLQEENLTECFCQNYCER